MVLVHGFRGERAQLELDIDTEPGVYEGFVPPVKTHYLWLTSDVMLLIRSLYLHPEEDVREAHILTVPHETYHNLKRLREVLAKYRRDRVFVVCPRLLRVLGIEPDATITRGSPRLWGLLFKRLAYYNYLKGFEPANLYNITVTVGDKSLALIRNIEPHGLSDFYTYGHCLPVRDPHAVYEYMMKLYFKAIESLVGKENVVWFDSILYNYLVEYGPVRARVHVPSQLAGDFKIISRYNPGISVEEDDYGRTVLAASVFP